ncbi:MAG TPA: metallophosphoesterase [Ktedonobacterales bacterium]|nr:metallophosphoesterase [Ktedonobacterales bacterium]
MSAIVVTSDLHLGITKVESIRALVEAIAAEQPDLTVLAGDLGEGLARIRECLALFASLPGQVAALAGNHDVWAFRDGPSSQRMWEEYMPAAVREAGMLWLEDEVWRAGDLAVTGSLAWYDYSAVDATIPPYPPAYFASEKPNRNMDGRHVDWPWSDLDVARRLGDGLCARLDALEHDDAVRDVLVVTHVPLCERQMRRRPDDPRWGFGNAYFGNLTLGRRALAYSKVRRIVSGHTHIAAAGIESRPGLPDVPVEVIPSDFGSPRYVTLKSERLAGLA